MSEMNLPTFYVGQKVVCIKEAPKWVAKRAGMFLIKKDTILTVRGFSKTIGSKGIFFKEIINKPSNHYPEADGREGCYASHAFAPIQENFQSISLSKVLEEETKLISVN